MRAIAALLVPLPAPPALLVATHLAATLWWQVCKAKLGSHKRAKAKREDMQESMRQARMAEKAAK